MIIVTDTASDILESEAAALDVRLATIDVMFDNVHCARNTPEGFDEFYKPAHHQRNLPHHQPASTRKLFVYLCRSQRRLVKTCWC